MNEQIETVDRVTATALDMAIRFGPKVAVALVILAAGYYLGRWAGGLTQRQLARRKLEPPVVKLLVRTVKAIAILADAQRHDSTANLNHHHRSRHVVDPLLHRSTIHVATT